MAFPNLPAICSTAANAPYLRLSVFPPAQGYCSNLFSEKPVQVDDPKCRNGSEDLCTLLSYLQAADFQFAQIVCCCIGDCHKPRSTLISIATSSEPNASPASSEIGSPGSTSSIQSDSSGVTTSEPPTSSSPSSPSAKSPTHTSSTILTPTKSSTTSRTRSIPSTAISSQVPSPSTSKTSPSSSESSSPTSYSTCATCSYPTPTAACTSINSYEQYHSGQCSIENTHNPGNIDPLNPPIYSTYPGTLNACDAATRCALQAKGFDGQVFRSEGFDADVYASFDLHYLCSNSSWVCVQYYGANFRGSYFDVQDFDAVVAYGYYSMGNHD